MTSLAKTVLGLLLAASVSITVTNCEMKAVGVEGSSEQTVQ